jgi:hypothetical protein
MGFRTGLNVAMKRKILPLVVAWNPDIPGRNQSVKAID